MSAKAILEIENLSYSYRADWSTKKTRALKNISLSVFSGESFGFLGHNGAGKTTTIKCLLGLITPTSGNIRIFGEAPRSRKAREKIGYIPEHPYYYDHLTVLEMVEMYAKLCGIKGNEIKKSVENALERVGIANRRKSPLRSLSKGLLQRAGLAQAIVAKPELLVLDEPFSGLDPVGRREFKNIFFELKKNGTSLFISTHILEDAEHLCDRVSILVQGKIEEVIQLSHSEAVLPRYYELILPSDHLHQQILESRQITALPHGHALKIQVNERALAYAVANEIIAREGRIIAFREAQQSLEEHFIELLQTHKEVPHEA